jgi:sec-independent protein translocase protein TatC
MASDPIKKAADLEYTRMSFGDHLEELRKRIIWGLCGLVVATIVCFRYGDHIIEILPTPYCVAMERLGFDPRMVQLAPVESFMEYFKIAMEFGLVVAAPWILYQLWLFIAAGLYPRERRVVRYFAPTSIALFIVGASFMVTIVLSGLMNFLIGISMWFPLPSHDNWLYRFLAPTPEVVTTTSQPAAPMEVPILATDPPAPADGQLWYNPNTHRLNFRYHGETYYPRLEKAGSGQFVQPFFSVADYLGFVVNLALAFGLGFQIPLVVVLLCTLGIVPVATMAGIRKYVILIVLVLAAILTPTPDIGTMLLLAVPMLLLYEAGILVSRFLERRHAE